MLPGFTNISISSAIMVQQIPPVRRADICVGRQQHKCWPEHLITPARWVWITLQYADGKIFD
jgi:hypothetical protein